MQLLQEDAERPSPDDETLLFRFVNGEDAAALDELIRRYSPTLRGLLATMLRASPEEMADAEQEVFLALVRKAHSFRGRARFSTFFYALARNRVLDLIRSRSRYRLRFNEATDFDGVASRDPGPEARLLAEERRERVRGALDRLKPDDRFLLFMKEVEGMSVRDLAEIAGMQENTVKSRLKRSRDRMATLLGDESL